MTYVEPGILLAIVLAAMGLIPNVRRRCGGRNLLTPLALLGLFCWSFPPVAILHSSLLEGRYPAPSLPVPEAGVIVVLSGGLDESPPPLSATYAATSTYKRTMDAAWLHRNGKSLPIVVSGGPIGRAEEGPSAAEVMKQILLTQGVPNDQILLEDASHSTFENAVLSAALLRKQGISRILLVTDAVHMTRAELAFRHQGLDVLPSPCCFYSAIPLEHWYDYIPTRRAIRANEATLHEWLGLLWYRVRGRI